jgi:hypothetical protein
MSELDLIPQDYARRQRLRRRLRLAAALLVSAACLVVLARSALGVLLASERQQLARLEAKKLAWQQSKTKTEQYTSEALAIEKQLRALDELRGRDQLRLLLEALDSAHVDKVWFDEIRYYRREKAPEKAPEKAQQKAPRAEQHAGVTGHATDHATLADFMRRLETQPGVAELTLLDTSARRYPNRVIIDFKLSLVVDQSVRSRP